MFKNLILVGLGGCLGSMMRYTISHFLKSANFPAATILVNIIGSLVIGMIMAMSIKDANFPQSWKIFLASGICGGFTTFSAFSGENLQMIQNGKYFLSMLYICSSIILGIAAAWLGFKFVTN